MRELDKTNNMLRRIQAEFSQWATQHRKSMAELATNIARTQQDHDNSSRELSTATIEERAASAAWEDGKARLATLLSATEHLWQSGAEEQTAKQSVSDKQSQLQAWKEEHGHERERVAAELEETIRLRSSRTNDLPSAIEAEDTARRDFDTTFYASGLLARTVAWFGLGPVAELERVLGRATNRRTALEDELGRLARQQKELAELQQTLVEDGPRRERAMLLAIVDAENHHSQMKVAFQDSRAQWLSAASAASLP
jgi:hypothetical protein